MKRSHVTWSLPILSFAGLSLVFLSLSRMGLMLWQWPRVAHADGVLFILFQGIRYDLILLGYLLLIPLTLTPLLFVTDQTRRITQPILTSPYGTMPDNEC